MNKTTIVHSALISTVWCPNPAATSSPKLSRVISRDSTLHFHEDIDAMIQTANCIPCMIPYITAQFMPRAIGDRPQVVPQGSTNLAFVGQFCEIPNDVVVTEEYSFR
ncbi:oleate hydratase [Paenibacillus thiaminolyticus]|uniref:oleate hydratase n=1 Tax=Paenibacillus thiaminolyticus TaxID=49283 RepID=UPI003D6CF08F